MQPAATVSDLQHQIFALDWKKEETSKVKRTFFIWRATVEGRKRVKYYRTLSWQLALVLYGFREVSLWWKVFQWHKALAAEVIQFCCRKHVLASERQWERQFWQEWWPASVPPPVLLVCESVLQECREGIALRNAPDQDKLGSLLVAAMARLAEAWQTVPGIMERSTRMMLMDYCSQNWAFRADALLPFPLILEFSDSM